jgi:hypothetical protein
MMEHWSSTRPTIIPRTRIVPTSTSSADRITPDSSLMKLFMVVCLFCVYVCVRENERCRTATSSFMTSPSGAENQSRSFRRDLACSRSQRSGVALEWTSAEVRFFGLPQVVRRLGREAKGAPIEFSDAFQRRHAASRSNRKFNGFKDLIKFIKFWRGRELEVFGDLHVQFENHGVKTQRCSC